MYNIFSVQLTLGHSTCYHLVFLGQLIDNRPCIFKVGLDFPAARLRSLLANMSGRLLGLLRLPHTASLGTRLWVRTSLSSRTVRGLWSIHIEDLNNIVTINVDFILLCSFNKPYNMYNRCNVVKRMKDCKRSWPRSFYPVWGLSRLY